MVIWGLLRMLKDGQRAGVQDDHHTTTVPTKPRCSSSITFVLFSTITGVAKLEYVRFVSLPETELTM